MDYIIEMTYIISLMIPLISDFMDDASHTCDAGHSTPTAMLWCVYSKKGQ